MLADSIGIPCRLVRGCKHCQREDSASCVVQIDDREYVVNILTKPGILDEPDGPPNSTPFHRNVTSPLYPRASSDGSQGEQDKGKEKEGEGNQSAAGKASQGGDAGAGKHEEGGERGASAEAGGGGQGVVVGRGGGGEASTSGREMEDAAEAGNRATPPSVRRSVINRGAQWAESSIWAEKKTEEKTDAMSEWEIPWEELVIGERIGAGKGTGAATAFGVLQSLQGGSLTPLCAVYMCRKVCFKGCHRCRFPVPFFIWRGAVLVFFSSNLAACIS